MLEEIRIRGLGVIDEAVLELGPGFTVLTGETGAGKTMVVTSLHLLLGGRTDAGVVRQGASGALVEGRMRLSPDSAAAHIADDAGAALDDDALLLARSVSAEGRSRAFAGGRTVPVGVLSELAEETVAVHGQSEQQHLLRPAKQRAALDRFAGASVSVPLAAYTAAYDRLRVVERRLAEITELARERLREADLLRDGLARIDEVAPQSSEDVELLAEESRLAHADELRTATALAHGALRSDSDEGDAVAALAGALRALDAVAEHDPALVALAGRVRELGFLVDDVAADLAGYTEGVETDPARLAAVQERRAALAGLTRRYGDDIAAVLTWAETARGRLSELDDDDATTEALREERTALIDELERTAGEMSAARTTAATKFSEAVTGELASLALPNAHLVADVRQTDVDGGSSGLRLGERRVAYGTTGVDDVELLLAPHPGSPPRPLAKGASGGELSRVMLAVEVVFAGTAPVPTFVFDEVDAGVGGKAAVEVGRRLAALARTAQVLVVTHLPQVAAYADAHLTVVKSSDGSVTRSGVVALDADGRVRELARMLAGVEESETAQAHAAELLAAAAQERCR